MRIPATLSIVLTAALVTLVAVFPVACGGGREKEAFAAYDAAVSPLLEEEEALYRKFAELTTDALSYGGAGEQKAGDFMHARLIPFNEKMGRQAAVIQPEGRELTKIHGYLVRYVKLRTEYFSLVAELEALEREYREVSQPVRDRIAALRAVVQTKGAAIQPAFEAAPQMAANLKETLTRISTAAQRYEQMLAALDGGAMTSDAYRKNVEESLLPWLRQVRQEVSALGATGEDEVLKKVVVDFISSIEGLMEASRPLIRYREEREKKGGPDPKRVENLMKGAAETIKIYREEALAYRNRLR